MATEDHDFRCTCVAAWNQRGYSLPPVFCEPCMEAGCDGDVLGTPCRVDAVLPAQFHCFKPSGKWYTSAPGHLPSSARDESWRLTPQSVLEVNGGCWPGLSSDGSSFIRVVIPDDGVPFLWAPAR